MATDIERLIVTLEARTKEYERALAKAQGTTVTQLRKIERQTQQHAARQQATLARMGGSIQQTIQRSLIGPLTALAGAAGARLVVGFADSFTRMENTLKVAGVQGRALTATLEDLFDIANKHSAPVEALATLYGRLALSQEELNISSQEMVKFTDNVGAALRVSGRSASETSGALLQLSQALGGGIVRAEEFNSILEGAQPIAQAVANGLDEAGGSIARLRQLVIDGKVTSDVFFRAFQAGGEGLQEQANQAEKTVGQAMTNINNAFIEAVGSIDETTGASAALAEGMGELARQVRLAAEDFKELKQGAENIVDFFQAVDDAIRKAGRDWGLADALGTELADVRATLAEYLRLQDAAVAAGNDALARHYDDLARALIAKINAIEPGPAFERKGREGGLAFIKGVKDTVSLAGAVAAAGPVVAGGLSTQSHAVAGANGPVSVTITRPVDIEPAGIEAGNRDIATALDRGFSVYDEHGRRISDHTGRTADEVREFGSGFDRVGDRFASALGAQTDALVSAFESGLARTAGTTGDGPGAFGGSVGGSQRFKFSVNVAARKELDALAAERDVIQSGLGVKDLTPEQEREAQLRLAEIDLETAKLNQHMGEVSAAFQDLHPVINQMLLDGMDFQSVLSRLNSDLKARFGAGGADFFSSTAIPQFASGGAVRGPGGPKSDSVPIMASAGEFVVNAASTKKHRALLDAINGGSLARMADGGIVGRLNGAAQRLANGGMVQSASASSGPRWQGDINVPVTIMAAEGGVSRSSTRDVGRQVARETAHYMREMGII